MEQKPLYMPVGVKREPELFEGFRKKDSGKAVTGSLVIVFLSVIAYLIWKDVLIVITILLFGITGVFSMLIRNPVFHLSPVEVLMQRFRFYKEQQEFQYIRRDEWRDRK